MLKKGFMGRKKLPGQLVGIRLLPDSYIPQCLNAFHLNTGKVIGTVFIPIEGTNCSILRRNIQNAIPDAPKEFRFLTSAGWPFDATLEDKIYVTDCLSSGVVTIQKQHGNGRLSRIGIKLQNGQILGFIFLSFRSEISHIRSHILSDLDDQFEGNESFEFIDNNLWPVRESQENNLSVFDLVVNNCITIVKKQLKRNSESIYKKTDKRLKIMRRPTLDITGTGENSNSESILISYVHNEASTYARALKTELRKMGFTKIFLDVDDIPAGHDWQDVISLAVHNCSVFVPLVTQRYGETRWTNREAKLADDKQKNIIPISFLNKWPPDQLAIQFVTLQYIPWKSVEDNYGGSFTEGNNSLWNTKSVQRVAREIKKLCKPTDISTPDSVSLLEQPRSSAVRNFSLDLSENQKSDLKKNKKDLVVISAHCKQKTFVEKIIKMLKNIGYEVWHSTNQCEIDENACGSPLEDTQPVMDSPVIESNGLPTSPHTFDKGTLAAIEHSTTTNSSQQFKRDFRYKVKEAKVVVLIFSEDYLKSRICIQQLYYCEQRKTAIVIKYGNFQIDSRVLNLYPEHEMIMSENCELIKFKLKEKLKFDTYDSYRSNIMLSVSKLKNVVDTEFSVYIIGGTKTVSKSAVSFSMVLGTELAKVNKLSIATEGFNGAGDLVGRNFCEEQEISNKSMPPNVYHIIPIKDNADYSEKAKQSSDGTFEKLPYGNTLYYGISVSNRDDIVAAAFKLCILIEGGERSACLAEKFLWNDCTVIPVLYNNTAVKTKQCLKESINKVPNGVKEIDWQNLNRSNCSPEERAKCVRRIVCALLNLNS